MFYILRNITIEPLFWLTAGLIGWINTHDLLLSFFWVIVIFFSVVIHELGHALTAYHFGQKVRIKLMALGD